MKTRRSRSHLGPGNALYEAFTGVTAAQAAQTLQSISGAGVVGAMPGISASFSSPVMTHIATTGGAVNAVNTAAAGGDPSLYTAAYIEPAAGMDRDIDAWLQAIGGFGRTQRSSQSPSQDRGHYGMVAGIDRSFDNINGRFGLFGGWQFSDFSSDAVGSSSEVNSYQLGGYVQRPLDSGFTVTGGAAAMVHDIETVRHVMVGAAGFSPHGDTWGNTLTAFAELSHPLNVAGLTLEGFGTLSVTRNHTNGYSETDGGAANLVVQDVTKTNPATTIGIRGGKNIGHLAVTGSLGWQHTMGDVESNATMRFAGGNSTFTSTGTPIARDAGVVSLNLSTGAWSGAKAYAGYDGTLSRDAQDHGFKAGVKIEF